MKKKLERWEMIGYGKELILDLHECNPKKFNRKNIKLFCEELCREIDMEVCDIHFWDDTGVPVEEQQTSPHTKGTSAVQFIITSNITIHALDLLKKVFLNIFSCKDFDSNTAAEFVLAWFGGKLVNRVEVARL